MYARALRGERAVGRVRRNHGTPTTVVTVLSPEGIQAVVTLPGALDKLAFRVFVRNVLGPALRPGQVVATDNLIVHHDPEVKARIETRDGLRISLPSYSPDLAPVELAIAKIKAHLRRAQPARRRRSTRRLPRHST